MGRWKKYIETWNYIHYIEYCFIEDLGPKDTGPWHRTYRHSHSASFQAREVAEQEIADLEDDRETDEEEDEGCDDTCDAEDNEDVAVVPVPTARFNLGSLSGAGLATAAKKKAAPAKSTRRKSEGDSDLMETGEAAQSISEAELMKARQTHDLLVIGVIKSETMV